MHRCQTFLFIRTRNIFGHHQEKNETRDNNDQYTSNDSTDGGSNEADRPRQIKGSYIDKKGNIKKPDEHLSRIEDNNEVRPQVSIAIDFGASNCAVAFSTESNRDKIIVINKWRDGVPTDGKIPSCILFDKEQKFIAFGNEAIDKYQELVMDEEHKDYYYFEKFKMVLYGEKVNQT